MRAHFKDHAQGCTWLRGVLECWAWIAGTSSAVLFLPLALQSAHHFAADFTGLSYETAQLSDLRFFRGQ